MFLGSRRKRLFLEIDVKNVVLKALASRIAATKRSSRLFASNAVWQMRSWTRACVRHDLDNGQIQSVHVVLSKCRPNNNTAQRATQHDIQFCSINCFVVMCQRTWYIIHSLHSPTECNRAKYSYWLYLCRLCCLFFLIFAHSTILFDFCFERPPHTNTL